MLLLRELLEELEEVLLLRELLLEALDFFLSLSLSLRASSCPSATFVLMVGASSRRGIAGAATAGNANADSIRALAIIELNFIFTITLNFLY